LLVVVVVPMMMMMMIPTTGGGGTCPAGRRPSKQGEVGVGVGGSDGGRYAVEGGVEVAAGEA